MDGEVGEVLPLLGSHHKLDRDRAVQQLEHLLTHSDDRDKSSVGHVLASLLEDSSQTWEYKQGALMGIKCWIAHLTLGTETTDELITKIKNLCLKLLSENEVRVRLSAGEVLGTLCAHCGPQIYLDCKDIVLDMISSNVERRTIEDAASQDEQEETDKLMEKFASCTERRRLSAEEIFHDTAGWKCLETSMKALQLMVDGCGSHFLPFINQPLLDLISQALLHTNRFVRETGFYVCSSLVNCASQTPYGYTDSNPLFEFGHQLSKFLGLGMSDNWSQVRLAASVATRQFLLSFRNPDDREIFFPELLPKMCLNRYYLADGVRLYSQETWKIIVNDTGRDLVTKYIQDVVDFYISQTQADNHAVREASCSCVAELAAKISRETVKAYVPKLLKTLIQCFQDDSWPVRDAACLACGNFVVCFPEECRSSLDALFPLFFINLEDNIPSVRQGAAAALSNVVKAYGQEAVDVIAKKLEEGLKAVHHQDSESEKYGKLEKGPATFGVVKKLRDNDMELHTNQTMYSCGSLAPKMGRGRLGGCMDRTFRRPPQPWELTDGCVLLLAELSSVPSASQQMVSFLPLLIDAVKLRHYTHHVVLTETMCKQLPIIAKGIGKQAFKSHLEAFFEPIFYGLSCENALTCTAAKQCLTQLSNFIGPGIMRGRVEQYDPGLLALLDADVGIAPL